MSVNEGEKRRVSRCRPSTGGASPSEVPASNWPEVTERPAATHKGSMQNGGSFGIEGNTMSWHFAAVGRTTAPLSGSLVDYRASPRGVHGMSAYV